MAAFTGGCACGAVRYTCAGAPKLSLNCHCRDCQRLSGSAYLAAMIVDRRTFAFTQGTPTFYAVTAANGMTKRHGFCGQCGAPLVVMLDERPRIIAIAVGSVDEPALYQPMADMWVESAQPWDSLDPALPKHPQGYQPN
jgi:hypothetical protein